jgi:hypothetical protein
MRAGTHCAVLIIAAIAAGCSTQLTAPPSVVLRAADGPVWIRTEEIGRFRCARGLLTCDDAVGRLSQRRCRCLE